MAANEPTYQLTLDSSCQVERMDSSVRSRNFSKMNAPYFHAYQSQDVINFAPMVAVIKRDRAGILEEYAQEFYRNFT